MSNIEAASRSRQRPHDVEIGGNVFKEFYLMIDKTVGRRYETIHSTTLSGAFHSFTAPVREET